MAAFTLVFLAATAFMVVTRLWLAARQAAAVGARAGTVPEPFRDTISDADHERACAYTRDRLLLGRLELVAEAVALLAVTVGGGYAWLDARVGDHAFGPLAHGVVVLVCLALALGAWGLPFSLWSTFRIEARYGFNHQTPALYFVDLARGVLIGAALGVPLLTLVLWLMQSAGGLWWLYAWAAWVAFGLGLTAAYPRFLAPLFNRFSPLEPGPLRERLERLVAACGFRSDGLYVMDGSRRSSHGNAYFTGVGGHKRIVLFDTLVERLEGDELEAVLAHELGHFSLHHVRTRLLLSFVTSLGGFAVLGWLARQAWFFRDLGVPTPSMAAALALFALVAPIFLFPLGPLSAWWSRRDEYAADRYAAAHADARALSRALVKLYRDNAAALTPDRWYSAWHDSHPPAIARIDALSRITT